MNMHIPSVECVIPLNRGDVEDFMNRPENIRRHKWALACEMPYLKAVVNKQLIDTGFIAIATWVEDENTFRITHITSLS